MAVSRRPGEGPNASRGGRPTLAVFKFASCDGCQLSLLDCEDELLQLAERVVLANFAEASRAVRPGPYDITLVEGSVTTPGDAERLLEVRAQTRYLVTLGACATAGGVQALRNLDDVTEYARYVYARPDWIATLARSTPIAAHVRVDFELRGCPVNKSQLLEVIASLLAGRRPRVPEHAVCVECKLQGIPCLLVSKGAPCLGPVTHAGCGALCPSFQRACFGCYGPQDTAHADSFRSVLTRLGQTPAEQGRVFHSYHVGSSAFYEAGQHADPSHKAPPKSSPGTPPNPSQGTPPEPPRETPPYPPTGTPGPLAKPGEHRS